MTIIVILSVEFMLLLCQLLVTLFTSFSTVHYSNLLICSIFFFQKLYKEYIYHLYLLMMEHELRKKSTRFRYFWCFGCNYLLPKLYLFIHFITFIILYICINNWEWLNEAKTICINNNIEKQQAATSKAVPQLC